MDRFVVLLHKNENNPDILHESILRYCRLNLFKEIAIGLKHRLQTTLKSFANLYDDLLFFKIVNAVVIFVFSWSLVFHESLLFSRWAAPHA